MPSWYSGQDRGAISSSAQDRLKRRVIKSNTERLVLSIFTPSHVHCYRQPGDMLSLKGTDINNSLPQLQRHRMICSGSNKGRSALQSGFVSFHWTMYPCSQTNRFTNKQSKGLRWMGCNKVLWPLCQQPLSIIVPLRLPMMEQPLQLARSIWWLCPVGSAIDSSRLLWLERDLYTVYPTTIPTLAESLTCLIQMIRNQYIFTVRISSSKYIKDLKSYIKIVVIFRATINYIIMQVS